MNQYKIKPEQHSEKKIATDVADKHVTNSYNFHLEEHSAVISGHFTPTPGRRTRGCRGRVKALDVEWGGKSHSECGHELSPPSTDTHHSS